MKKLSLCLLLLSSLSYASPLKLHPRIKAFVTLLKNDSYRLAHNVEIPSGVLIADHLNPKGMAQWMSNELEANFFEFSLHIFEMIRKEHGQGSITELLLSSDQLAQSKNKKSVIFIENLHEFNTDEAAPIRDELIAYFDKSEKTSKTILVASCNTTEVHTSLTEAGRFTCLINQEQNRSINNPQGKKLSMVVDHLPHRLKMILKLLKNQEKYKKQFNLTIPRGILLTGKPGTGKTEFARHVAQELEGFFVLCSSTQFVTQWQGSGEQEIRKIFEAAKAHAELTGKVVVIFLDEIDAIASLRTNNGVANMGYEKALNELLIQMDGFEQDSNILVIGATNIPDKLDPAIKRSGRFDYIVEIPEPSFTARKKLFQHFLDQFKSVDTDIKLDQLANKELTPADIKNIVNQAAHEAAFVDAPKITQKLLERALNNIVEQKKKSGSSTNKQSSTWQDLINRNSGQQVKKKAAPAA